MKDKVRPSRDMNDPVGKYASELEKHIGLKDKEAKDQIISDIVNRIRKERDMGSYDQIVKKFGRPSGIGAKLSDPSNWIMDIGTPLKPNIDLPSFFSARGRLLFMSLFIFCIAGLIGLIISGIARDPVLIGSLIILLIFWIVATSLINDHLAYFAVLRSLKDQNLGLETIDNDHLRKGIIAGLFLTALIFTSIVVISYFINKRNLFILLPLSFSSMLAYAIASMIVLSEGKSVLEKLE